MFNAECGNKIGYYVYKLIDPRNGHVFYVGKGSKNRVFDHLNCTDASTLQKDDDIDLKSEIIQSIRNAREEVTVIIHRHGMDENTAFEVEAALMDATPGLTNVQGGHRSDDFGPASPAELTHRYDLEEFKHDTVHDLLLININKAWDEGKHEGAYEMVRFAWKISCNNASNCDYVLAVAFGIVRGVFVANKWLEANWPEENRNNFLNRPIVERRYGFEGRKANTKVENRYLDKRLPEHWLPKKGARNPVRYSANILRNHA